MPQVQQAYLRGRAAPAAIPANLGPTPTWIKVGNVLTYSAFTAAATTSTISLFQLPASSIIHGIKIAASTAFAGPGITGYTISVGDVGTPTLYASAFNVLQAVGPLVYQLSSNFGGESMIAATQIYATAVSTGANLSVATAGVVNIYALLSVCV